MKIIDLMRAISIFITMKCIICLSYSQNIKLDTNCNESMLQYVKTQSYIQQGGCDLFNFEGKTYVVGVASIAVGNKTLLNCKKVGYAKAKKEIISYINGSEISSYTELVTSESTPDSLCGHKVEVRKIYMEKVKEKVFGVINQCTPLGGWYSEDGSVYYYAIFKLIE